MPLCKLVAAELLLIVVALSERKNLEDDNRNYRISLNILYKFYLFKTKMLPLYWSTSGVIKLMTLKNEFDTENMLE